MMDTVQAWPEYPEMLEILREMVVYVERMSKLLREIYLRGNVFNNWKFNVNSSWFVFACIECYNAE